MISLIKNIELNSTTADNHLRFIEYNVKNHRDTCVIEQLYEGALSICGLHPTEGPIIWNDYRRYLGQLESECSSSRIKKIRYLFYRQMSLPLSGLPDLLDEYRLWEEELSEESKDSLDLAKEYYFKGQYEWNLRKPFEMKVQTDNVSNLQELFDAWMSYINFEKDKMLSIEYSSEAEHHIKDSCYFCSNNGPYKEYVYDSKDSVIMAYRRALDDLGSLRIDLWFEFANFISTTANCSHLLSTIYASSLQHFETNHKLWIFYLRTIVEVAKEKVNHFNLFGHFYNSNCKTRSSLAWYPQNEKLMDLNNQIDVLEFYLNNILTEFTRIKELFKEKKKDMVEMYTIVTDSIFDLTDFLKSEASFCNKKDDNFNMKYDIMGKFKNFVKNTFEILKKLYLEGDSFINQRFSELKIDESENVLPFTEDSIILFYSQWINFESKNSNGVSTLLSITEKIINNYDMKLINLLSLIFSILKKLENQESKNFSSIINGYLSKKPEEIRNKILSEWKRTDTSFFLENFEKRRSEIINLNLPSPIVNCVNSNNLDNISIQESLQNVSPSVFNINNTFLHNTSRSGLNIPRAKDNNEGDFVCLSEIRLRRDKRRSRRKFTESDYETSSECSSESNSISTLIPNTNNSKLVRNFTPPNTPNCAIQTFMNSSILPIVQNSNLKLCSSANGNQQNIFNENCCSITPKHQQKSPKVIHDLEMKTQCTWDGREAIEPSIAPPIPPIPTLSSISSASSSSSQSSYSTKNSERVILPIHSNENLGIEKICEDSTMPPPPYTPKKNKLDKTNGINSLQLSISDSSDLNNNSENTSCIFISTNNNNISDKIEQSTLFLKFPKNLEMNEEKIKNIFLKNYLENIKEIRVIKDIKGNNKGYAYIDIEPEYMIKEIVDYSNSSDVFIKENIQISISNPPKTTTLKHSSKSKFRRRLKRRQIDDRSSDKTILVKNIDKNIDEKFITNYFQENLDVKIKNILISRDKTGKSRGFAFIEFFDSNDAFTAHMLNESKMGANVITISSSTRPLTFPKHQWLVDPQNSINARLAPRKRSKQKLPLQRNSEELNNYNKQISSLSNEDFKNFIAKI